DRPGGAQPAHHAGDPISGAASEKRWPIGGRTLNGTSLVRPSRGMHVCLLLPDQSISHPSPLHLAELGLVGQSWQERAVPKSEWLYPRRPMRSVYRLGRRPPPGLHLDARSTREAVSLWLPPIAERSHRRWPRVATCRRVKRPPR